MTKNILITGGSRGIGAETALLAAKMGYQVCISFHQNEKAANSIVDTIKSQGGNAIAIRAQVAIEAEVYQLFESAINAFGTITALVNNAGILDTQARLDEISLERFKKIFEVNVYGSFLCAKEAVKHMSTAKGGAGGAIVNVSSAASRLGSPNEYVDYAASKGAIDSMTLGLSQEVAAEGIRVNAVRPGLIYTDIHRDSGDQNRVDKLKGNVPMKRGGSPQEVANTIMWLISEQSSYITGSLLDVTGGR